MIGFLAVSAAETLVEGLDAVLFFGDGAASFSSSLTLGASTWEITRVRLSLIDKQRTKLTCSCESSSASDGAVETGFGALDLTLAAEI